MHLFDRRSGWNVLFDEVTPNSSGYSLAPRQVSIALTNACDLKCPYCYAPKTPARLDVNRVQFWLTELDEHGCLGVGFGGGEPTLHPAFAELCRFATQQTTLAVTFTTHGHHLTRELLATLDGHVHFLRLSMDGTHRTYESNRGRPFSAFLTRARDAAIISPIGLNVVVNHETMKTLSDVADIAAELGARELLLLPEQATPGRAGTDASTTQALNAWVRAYRGPVPLAVSEANADGLPVCRPLVHEKGLDAYVHVNAHGELSASSFATHRIPIGNATLLGALAVLRSTLPRGKA